MSAPDPFTARRLEESPDVDIYFRIRAVENWQVVDVYADDIPGDIEIAKILLRASVHFQDCADVRLNIKKHPWWRRWLTRVLP